MILNGWFWGTPHLWKPPYPYDPLVSEFSASPQVDWRSMIRAEVLQKMPFKPLNLNNSQDFKMLPWKQLQFECVFTERSCRSYLYSVQELRKILWYSHLNPWVHFMYWHNRKVYVGRRVPTYCVHDFICHCMMQHHMTWHDMIAHCITHTHTHIYTHIYLYITHARTEYNIKEQSIT